MKQKLTMAAVAVAALLAVAAAPSSASAAGWDLDVEVGVLPVKFNISGAEARFTQLGLLGGVICQKVEGSGEYKTATEGTLELTFTTCTRGTEVCQTEPALKEAIKTTSLVFHNIMIDSTTQVAGGGRAS
jgi:opacity protein-like surface antigen